MSATAEPDRPREPAGVPGGYRRWIAVLLVLVVGSLALGHLLGGGERRAGVTGERVRPYMLEPSDLASVSGAPVEAYRRTNPPLDLEQAERTASGVTVGRVPLPDDRHIVTYRRVGTGEEITQIVLLYDDPSRAEVLDSLAGSMVPGWIGLASEPFAMPGAQDSRLWTAEGYRAVSFRHGGVAVFLGSSGVGDHDGVLALAEIVIDRLESLPTATAVWYTERSR
jgi:hypothetical protein